MIGATLAMIASAVSATPVTVRVIDCMMFSTAGHVSADPSSIRTSGPLRHLTVSLTALDGSNVSQFDIFDPTGLFLNAKMTKGKIGAGRTLVSGKLPSSSNSVEMFFRVDEKPGRPGSYEGMSMSSRPSKASGTFSDWNSGICIVDDFDDPREGRFHFETLKKMWTKK